MMLSIFVGAWLGFGATSVILIITAVWSDENVFLRKNEVSLLDMFNLLFLIITGPIGFLVIVFTFGDDIISFLDDVIIWRRKDEKD